MDAVSPSIDQDDENLVRRIAQRDADALAGFYDRHCQTLLAVAMRILNDTTSAEDVIQEVFLQVWERAGAYDRALGKPIAWAVVITRNKAIDRLRARQRSQRLIQRATEETNEPDVFIGHAGDNDRGEHLRRALAALPDEQRNVIEMAFFDGLSQAEIAEKTREPLGTIKARIRRGMLRLRDKLEPIL